MKKLILTFVMALLGLVAYSQNSTYVNGYVKSNGTYVESYYRSDKNNTVIDNWSTKGNINPYTGETGKRNYSDDNNRSNNNSTNHTNSIYNSNSLYEPKSMFK